MIATSLMMSMFSPDAWADSDVWKIKSKSLEPNCNVGSTEEPSVELVHDDGSRTISIGFNKASDDVRVRIYSNGSVVVDDKETAVRNTVIDYTFHGAEPMECTVVVETDGQVRAVGSARISD